MSLFKKAEMSTAYLKMGIYGEAGSGKTYTASLIAKGLALFVAKKLGEQPPIMMVDTDRISSRRFLRRPLSSSLWHRHARMPISRLP